MKEIIKEGRTVDQAIELACAELGVERDQIDFDIISLPKRGFLGLRNTPAKVRVTLEEPEAEVKPQKTAPPKQSNPKKPVSTPSPSKPVAQKPQQKQKPAAQPKTEGKKPEKPERRENEVQKEYTFLPLAEVEGKARIAADYISDILSSIGVQAQLTVAKTESGIIIRLSGDGLGVIIGRRGETLDSLQYLAGLVANREAGDYMRVTIDSGNYREKRERTLEKLAQKLSASAIRNGRKVTLEPMNPYERRIIHATVSKIEGVSSSSVGEEPNRKVVIIPANFKGQTGSKNYRSNGNGGRPPRGGKKPYRGQQDKGSNTTKEWTRSEGHESGQKVTPVDVDREFAKELSQAAPEKKPVQTPQETKTEPIVRKQVATEGDDLPLYGKIEL